MPASSTSILFPSTCTLHMFRACARSAASSAIVVDLVFIDSIAVMSRFHPPASIRGFVPSQFPGPSDRCCTFFHCPLLIFSFPHMGGTNSIDKSLDRQLISYHHYPGHRFDGRLPVQHQQQQQKLVTLIRLTLTSSP